MKKWAGSRAAFFAFEGMVLLALVAFYVWRPFTRTYGDVTFTQTQRYLLEMLVSRTLGALLFFGMVCYVKYPVLGPGRPGLYLIFPFLVALNNFQWEAVIRREASFEGKAWEAVVLFFAALAIGCFEELVFRGLFLCSLLEAFHTNKKQILLVSLLSSVLFGLVHFLNLFEGASVGDTLMQVGYSTLIGAMCSLMLLLSGSVWYCMAVHALFDFGGMLLPTLGHANWFRPLTIALMAVLGVATAVVLLWKFLRTDTESLPHPWERKKREVAHEPESAGDGL